MYIVKAPDPGLSVDCDSLQGTQFFDLSNVDEAFTISVFTFDS